CCSLTFRGQMLSSVNILFCHSSWNEGGFCLPASLDLKIRIKAWGSLCSFLPMPWFVLWFWASYIPVPRAELLIFLSPRSLLVFPHPHFQPKSQERAGATLSAKISSGS
uniref:Uncharacterized protein n=1 Tax=Aotus nancymaae TaxID=37293 RepID=A0A2K5DL76_AOTNA